MTLNSCRANKRRRAFAMLEYVMLIIILLAGLFVGRSYVQRAFQGQYRKAGESFGYLRQYDPGASLDCTYDGIWYSQACFNNKILQKNCTHPETGTYDDCAWTVKVECKLGCG